MMMRFLLTVLCVLLTAAPASAECAWVLWEQEIRNAPNRMDERWSISRTYEARPQCQADVAKLMHENSGWRAGVFKALNEDTVLQEIRHQGGAVTTVTKRAVCVPASLDPRPRAKD